MTLKTANNALPYPEDKDAPNGPLELEELAKALDVLKWGSRNLMPLSGELANQGTIVPLSLTESWQTIEKTPTKIEPPVNGTLLTIAMAVVECSEGQCDVSLGIWTEDEGLDPPYGVRSFISGYPRATLLTMRRTQINAGLGPRELKLQAKRGAGGKATVTSASGLYVVFAR